MLELSAFRVVFGFWFFLVLAANNCCGEKDTVEVVGGAECADCVQHNIKTSQAFKGLHVTIDCKSENGKLKTRGGSKLDQEGKFRATLPGYKIAKDGGQELKEDCFAQLHSASGAPCKIQNDKKDSKVVPKSKADGKQVLGLNGNLKFSSTSCTSAFSWPFPFPNFPFFSSPPPPSQPLPPSTPVYTTPPPPQPQPLPPSPAPGPVYIEPNPTPGPVYNDPAPTPGPVYNDPAAPTPSPVQIEPSPPPSAPSPDYGQFVPPPSPAYKKPLPALASPHKSFPQIPRAPPIPELPPVPTTPRKFFNKPTPPSPSRA